MTCFPHYPAERQKYVSVSWIEGEEGRWRRGVWEVGYGKMEARHVALEKLWRAGRVRLCLKVEAAYSSSKRAASRAAQASSPMPIRLFRDVGERERGGAVCFFLFLNSLRCFIVFVGFGLEGGAVREKGGRQKEGREEEDQRGRQSEIAGCECARACVSDRWCEWENSVNKKYIFQNFPPIPRGAIFARQTRLTISRNKLNARRSECVRRAAVEWQAKPFLFLLLSFLAFLLLSFFFFERFSRLLCFLCLLFACLFCLLVFLFICLFVCLFIWRAGEKLRRHCIRSG